MLILFVGWGGFFLYLLCALPPLAEPGGRLRRRQAPRLDLARGRRRGGRGDPADRLRDPALGRRASTGFRRRRTRSWSAWSASSSPGTSTIPARTASSAAPTIEQDRPPEQPAGARPRRSRGQGRRHHGQPALPAGQQAGDRPAEQQGRDPQLQRPRVPRQAGRRARASSIPVWLVPTVTTAEMRQKLGKPEFVYEIACAQLCGLGHYRMRGFVTMQSRRNSRSGWRSSSRRRPTRSSSRLR